MVLWIHIAVTDLSILLIFKFKQYKNVNISNLVHYGKTRTYQSHCRLDLWELKRVNRDRKRKELNGESSLLGSFFRIQQWLVDV